MRCLTAVLLSVLCLSLAGAHPAPSGEVAPQRTADPTTHKTHFERFASAESVILQTERFPMTSLQNLPDPVGAVLVRVTNIQTSESVIGLRLFRTGVTRGPTPATATLDADELDSLASALEHIRTHRQEIIDKATSSISLTYQSRDGCTVAFGVRIGPEGKTPYEFVSINNSSPLFQSLDDLEKTVNEARMKIGEIGKK